MKFLIDENLPRRLVNWLGEQGFDSSHILDIGERGISDREVGALALSSGSIVLTKDADFLALAAGDPRGAIIRLEIGNATPQQLFDWLKIRLPDLVRRIENGERLIEVR